MPNPDNSGFKHLSSFKGLLSDIKALRGVNWLGVGEEATELAKEFFGGKGFRISGLSSFVALLTIAIALRDNPAIVLLAALVVLLFYAYYLCFLVWSAKDQADTDRIATPVNIFPLYRYPQLRCLARPFFWAIDLISLGYLAGLAVFLLQPCPGAAYYTFSDHHLGPWVIRNEGSKRMGLDLQLSSEVSCRGNPVNALKFGFQLGPDSGAQVGLDGQGHQVNSIISAWMYVPPNTPATLQFVCFIMDKPERNYAWFETDAVNLKIGSWVKVNCPADSFHNASGKGYTAWANPPQFIGFGFLDSIGKAYPGTVYITSIDIQ